MSPYLFDICVVLLIALSAGLGFLRGFCNEIFTIFGWIGAVVATILLTPLSREFLRGHIENKIIADLATASAIFIVTMIAFSVISHYATKSLHHSKLGAVDRSLGLGFGLLRGAILLGLAFLLIAWIWSPENRPEAVREAHTRPLLEETARLVQFIMPGDPTIAISAEDAKLQEEQAAKAKDDPKITENINHAEPNEPDTREPAKEFTAPVKADSSSTDKQDKGQK
jgi:membrane protein required for colicin V production